MTKIKISDMSYVDAKEYQYYKRVLRDLCVWGPRYFKERAKDQVNKIEGKYEMVEEQDLNTEMDKLAEEFNNPNWEYENF